MERQVLQYEAPTPRILRRNRTVRLVAVPRRLRQPRQPGADHHARGNRNPLRNSHDNPHNHTRPNANADPIPNRQTNTYQHLETNPYANPEGTAHVFQLCRSHLV